MLSFRPTWLFTSLLLLLPALAAQQQPQRDPQAVAILQQALVAMGGLVPQDSTATGTVTVVEGSTTQTGTIQILTRGHTQTAEITTLPNEQRAVVYSNADAREVRGADSSLAPMELALTDQCPGFPLPLLLSLLNNPDEAFSYIGQETLNGAAVHHIQAWNTFASKPRLQPLAPFSTRGIWFDSTGLPVKIAYARRAAEGAAPTFPVEVYLASYTSVGGVLYPFHIKKSYNGTPWETITIRSVAFNTGLTDAQFPVP